MSEKLIALEKIKKQAQNCSACELGKTKTNLVFSDGSLNAKIFLIGEAPGADEDMSGVPFVGRAGKLLNQFLEQAGIDRQKDLYIANILKCRPPQNRTPLPCEKNACFDFLKQQIEIVNPKIIILCGSCAMSMFLPQKQPISKVRGQWFDYQNGIKMIPIFHPSYLLRNHSIESGKPRALTLSDLIKIKELANL